MKRGKGAGKWPGALGTSSPKDMLTAAPNPALLSPGRLALHLLSASVVATLNPKPSAASCLDARRSGNGARLGPQDQSQPLRQSRNPEITPASCKFRRAAAGLRHSRAP